MVVERVGIVGEPPLPSIGRLERVLPVPLGPNPVEVRVHERPAPPQNAGCLPSEARELRDVSRHERGEDEIESAVANGAPKRHLRSRVPVRVRALQHGEGAIETDGRRHSLVRQQSEVPAGPGAQVERPFHRKLLLQELHRRPLDAHALVVRARRVGLGPDSIASVRLEKRNHQNPVVLLQGREG